MATLTNNSRHTTTLTNSALSQKTFGQYTMAELAALTISQRANLKFTDKYIAFTNIAKD